MLPSEPRTLTGTLAHLGGEDCGWLRASADLLAAARASAAASAAAAVTAATETNTELQEHEPVALPSDGHRVSVYDALDQSAIDFKDEHSDIAVTMSSFRRLPLLLMFYIPQRTAEEGPGVACDFDAVLQLDRYSDAPLAVAARDRCRQLRSEEAKLVMKRAEHRSVAEKFSEMLTDPALAPEELAALRGTVAGRKNAASAVGEQLERVRNGIRSCYDSVPSTSDFTYHLHAVIVHERVAQGGHYYAYVRDAVRGKERRAGGRWLRFDDAAVTTVHNDEVFSARTRRNAYCVFYTAARTPQTGLKVSVPAPLREIVEREDDRRQRILAELLDHTQQPTCP